MMAIFFVHYSRILERLEGRAASHDLASQCNLFSTYVYILYIGGDFHYMNYDIYLFDWRIQASS